MSYFIVFLFPKTHDFKQLEDSLGPESLSMLVKGSLLHQRLQDGNANGTTTLVTLSIESYTSTFLGV